MTYEAVKALIGMLKSADWVPKVRGAQVLQGIAGAAPKKVAPQLPLGAIMAHRSARVGGPLPKFSTRPLPPSTFMPKAASAQVLRAFSAELQEILLKEAVSPEWVAGKAFSGTLRHPERAAAFEERITRGLREGARRDLPLKQLGKRWAALGGTGAAFGLRGGSDWGHITHGLP